MSHIHQKQSALLPRHRPDELTNKHQQLVSGGGGRENELETLARHHVTNDAEQRFLVLGVVAIQRLPSGCKVNVGLFVTAKDRNDANDEWP